MMRVIEAHGLDWLTLGLLHMDDQHQRTITRETLIPLGLVGLVAAIAGSAGSWIATTGFAHRFDLRLQSIESEVAGLTRQVQATATGHWLERDARSWARLLAAENPELEVPIPGE